MSILVDLCAGAAAVSLRALAGARLDPPVSWMGGKRSLAGDILAAMGWEGRPDRVVLVDAGPWGWVWPVLLDPEQGARVCAILREWEGSDPRALWDALAAEPPAEDLAERAAQWLWLQARAASGVPVFWRGDLRIAERDGRDNPARQKGVDLRRTDPGWHQPDHDTGRTSPAWQATARPRGWQASDGRGDPRPVGQRGGGLPLGEWRMGEERKKSKRAHRTVPQCGGGRPRLLQGSGKGAKPQPAGQRNPHLTGGGGHARGIGYAACGGIIHPATIADRIDAIRWAVGASGAQVEVRHCDVSEVEPIPGAAVYFDPPYQGATGYGWDCARAEVLAVAQRWADAGCLVAVSEAVPLDLEGWHHVDMSPRVRRGGKPEWLTLSHPPVRSVATQLELLET